MLPIGIKQPSSVRNVPQPNLTSIQPRVPVRSVLSIPNGVQLLAYVSVWAVLANVRPINTGMQLFWNVWLILTALLSKYLTMWPKPARITSRWATRGAVRRVHLTGTRCPWLARNVLLLVLCSTKIPNSVRSVQLTQPMILSPIPARATLWNVQVELSSTQLTRNARR